MCLKYIGERESANEGIGYKELINIIRVKGGNSQRILVTAQLRYPIITDTWLLHKEPKKCAYKICCFNSKKAYNGMVDIRVSIVITTYDHGFHLWKTVPLDSKYSPLNRKTYKVYYKDIIAEDDTQIVAKQIYIADKTEKPSDSLVKSQETRELSYDKQ